MVREREVIEDEYKWDLDSLYSSDEEWEEEFSTVEERMGELEQFEGSAAESADRLLNLLKLREELKRAVDNLAAYAKRKYDQDTRADRYQAMNSRASSLRSRLNSSLSFLEPELQEAGMKRLEELMEEKDGLRKYEHFFRNVLRFRPHTRSKEIEDVLADLGDVLDAPGEAYKALMNADISFPEVERPEGGKVEITQSNFTNLLKNGNRDFRRKVHEELYSEVAKVKNTLTSNLEKKVRKNVKLARIRDHPSARKASLFRNRVSVEVYDQLLETVESNLDVLHSHLELKRKVLGVESMKPYDVYMPVTESGGPEIEYEDARDHVLEALAPLGSEYVEKARSGLKSGWVDVYENKGKRSGAYSSFTYDSHPYILLNYQDDVSSMYTLAHELGHAMHAYYTMREQPYVYSGYSIFVAEVASTVNEALLTRYLLENADDGSLKRHALNYYLEDFRSTLYRQTMFADFEKKVHERVEDGEALTPGEVTEIYGGLKSDFHGPVDMDEHIRREWMRIPHFYYYKFYVYQYATGISAAEDLAEQILSSGPERYIEFLKAGDSDYPLEVLREAGVDMETSEPVRSAIETYRENVERAEKLIL